MTQLFSTPGLEPYLILAQELMRRVYSEDSPEEINAWAGDQLQRLAGKGHETSRMTWPESFEIYEKLMAKRAVDAALPDGERKLLTWPWGTWTQFLDPLEPGMLALLAGSDGSGKSLYAENIAEHWAKSGYNVVLLHWELNKDLMLDRREVRHSGIPRRILKMGKLTPSEERERQAANERLRQWPGGITYVHTPGWTAEKALVEARILISEKLCDVFVVDYLEKMAPSPRQSKLFGTNLYFREADDVEQIKSFSEQEEVPVLLLAQLNKAGKGQSFSDLDRTAIRGAGEKTEKANIVIMIHRDTAETEMVQVRIDKNTIGPTGSFSQWMETTRFRVMDVQQ